LAPPKFALTVKKLLFSKTATDNSASEPEKDFSCSLAARK